MRAGPLLILTLLLAGCASTTSPASATCTSTPPPAASHVTGNGTLLVETTKGNFSILLDPADAPRTSEHLAKLAADGFYDCIPFHRYVENFVIQGGDPNCKGDGLIHRATSGCGSGGSGSPVPLEAGGNLTHEYAAVGLARSQSADSGDSQFYVVIDKAGHHSLDGSYTVFGRVVSGMDVVLQLREGDTMRTVRYSSG